MKFLFVHQNFPGQYLHIVRDLLADNRAKDGTHEIVFMTEPNANHLTGVRKVTYAKPPEMGKDIHTDAREFDLAMRRAKAAWVGAKQIAGLGFKPDVIIGHHGWGEMLNLTDVFPGVPMLGYFEYYYQLENSDVNFDPEFPMPEDFYSAVRSKNCVNLLALALEQHGQLPTEWQYSTYPKWARPQLNLLREGVNLEACKPDPARGRKTQKIGKMTITPRQKLVTYVARNLEPYRGFHTLMRALPRILDARPDVVVSIVGGDEVSYGASHRDGPWREAMLKEMKGKLDLDRITFHGKVPYEQHLALLRRSDAHIYLSYPFVASWSLREAMACGCVIVGADTSTVTEFITDRETGLVVTTLDPGRVAEGVLTALEDTTLAARLRQNARAYAEANLDMADYLTRYRALIGGITGQAVEHPGQGHASGAAADAKPAPKAKPAAKPVKPTPLAAKPGAGPKPVAKAKPGAKPKAAAEPKQSPKPKRAAPVRRAAE